MVIKNLIIYGVVQGVGFRYQMVDAAKEIGLKGWVKNRQDRTVEAMVMGTDEQVEHIIDWAMKGPPGSRVDKVEVSEGVGQFNDFEIRTS